MDEPKYDIVMKFTDEEVRLIIRALENERARPDTISDLLERFQFMAEQEKQADSVDK